MAPDSYSPCFLNYKDAGINLQLILKSLYTYTPILSDPPNKTEAKELKRKGNLPSITGKMNAFSRLPLSPATPVFIHRSIKPLRNSAKKCTVQAVSRRVTTCLIGPGQSQFMTIVLVVPTVQHLSQTNVSWFG